MQKLVTRNDIMTTDSSLLEQLKTQLTVSVPLGGKALADLSRNTAYEIAKRDGNIAGCPVFEAGGKLRMPTAPIRKMLGLE
jgi:hypothetical protein